MAGQLRSGVMNVELNAKTDEFTKRLQDAMRTVQRFAANMKQMGEALGAMGVGATAAIAAIAATSRAHLPEMDAALKSLKESSESFSLVLGQHLAPVIASLADHVRSGAEAFGSLAPWLQQLIAYSMAGVAGVGLLGGALGKVAGVVQGLAGSISLFIKPMVGGLMAVKTAGFAAMLPFIKFALIIGALVLVAALLHRVWKDYGDKIKSVFASLASKVADVAGAIKDGFVSAWDFVKVGAEKVVVFVLDKFAAMGRTIGRLLAPIADLLGIDGVSNAVDRLQNLTGEGILKDLKSGAELVANGIKRGLEPVVYGLKESGKYLGDSVKGLKDDVSSLLGDLLGGGTGIPGRGGKGAAGKGSGASAVASNPYLGGTEADREAAAVRSRRIKDQLTMERLQLDRSQELARLENDRFQAQLAGINAVGEASRLYWEKLEGYLYSRAEDGSIGGIAGQVVGQMGSAGSLMQGVSQGAAMGGPWGALAGGAMALLGETQAMEKLMEALQPLMDAFVGILDAVLLPVIEVISPVLDMFGELLGAIAPLLEIANMGLRFLQPVFEALGWVMGQVALAITKVTNWIFEQAANIVGIFSQHAAEQLRSRIKDTTELENKLKKLGPPIDTITDEIQKAADAITETNLPSIWKRNLEAFQAANFGRVPTMQTATTGDTYVSVYVDSKPVAAQVEKRQQARDSRLRGTIGRSVTGRMVLP